MSDFLLKSGPVFWLLLAVSIVAVTLFFERVSYFHRIFLPTSDFLNGIANLIRKGHLQEALVECDSAAGPVGRIVRTALLNRHGSRQEMRVILEEAASLELPRLERNLGALSTIVYVAPLLGFLGTVLGFIQVFLAISAQGGVTNLADLSAGIAQALVTSGVAMVITIPTLLAHQWISSKVDHVLHQLEKASYEMMNILCEKPADGRIIDFKDGSTLEKIGPVR